MKNENSHCRCGDGGGWRHCVLHRSSRWPVIDALAPLLENIKADFAKMEYSTSMVEKFNEGLSYTVGRKYIKVIADGGVWGFIVTAHNDKKFAKGDILLAANWSTPARNKARGNILDGGYSIYWTGPKYLT